MSNEVPQVFTAASQPFTTQDVALAFSLYLAGVPFADPSQPCSNLYDAEILSKLGYRGQTLEDAARQAHGAGKKGEVRYIFARTPELNDLLQTYTSEQKLIADGEGSAADHMAELIPDDPELRLKVAQVALKLRPQFVNLWKSMVPLIRVPNPGKTTTRDVSRFNAKGERVPGKEITSPGFRVVSINASQETRKRLKL